MENVMQGIIDMHIHAAPDVRARKLDDLELMEASVQRGVRAIVLKSHNVPTADRAYLVNRVAAEKYPDVKFTAFGAEAGRKGHLAAHQHRREPLPQKRQRPLQGRRRHP